MIQEMIREGESISIDLVWADTLSAGLEIVSKGGIDVVLLDLSLPDSHGLDTVVRTIDRTPDVPVVVLTGLMDEETANESVKVGAQDYLYKEHINPDILVRVIRFAVHRKQLENELRHTVEKLEEANQKILEQQESVMEEERLKVLLQMAGATAHELNQPLMALLGNIELMRMKKGRPEQLEQYMDRMEEAGKRMSRIVKKIQQIRHTETREYVNGTWIIDLNQEDRGGS